ncbi:hypothetical protein Ahy_B02g060052 [Arachis hypogaea]|uniref:Uncharacterized protein n=1 Tax=Arachis hypogaea TaxID=3818 RepID=A0A445AHQ0_ARAHY|nr:hypothetical protein Ahy_B02g060052 [Arachis hypogaea]
MFNSLPCSFNILLITSSNTNNNRNISIVINIVSDLFGYHLDSLEFVLRRTRESCLYDIHAKLRELACDVKLLLGCHCSPGRLLPIA